MLEYVKEEVGNLVAIVIKERIDLDDIKALVSEMAKKINQFGRINFYLEIRDSVKWEAKSFWSDINFNLKHAQDFRRVAFVGDEQLEEKIIDLLKPLGNGEIRWYSLSEKKEALNWLKG